MARTTNSNQILLKGLKDSLNPATSPDYPTLVSWVKTELSEQVKELEERLGLNLYEFSPMYLGEQYLYIFLFRFQDATLQEMGLVGAIRQMESVLLDGEAKIRVGLMNLGIVIEATI